MEPYVIVIIIAAAVGLASALAGAAIADDKGRSAACGCALGLLLSIVGVLVALLLPPDTEALARRKLARGELKLCAYCHEAIKVHATVCPHCQQPQPPPTEAQRLAASRVRGATGAMVRCPHCSAATSASNLECPVCSMPLPDQA